MSDVFLQTQNDYTCTPIYAEDVSLKRKPA